MRDLFDSLYKEISNLEALTGDMTPSARRKFLFEKREELNRDVSKWEYVEKPLLTEMLENIKKARPQNFYSLYNTKEDNVLMNNEYMRVLSNEKDRVLQEVEKNGGASSKFAKVWPFLLKDIQSVTKYSMAIRDVYNDNWQLRQYLKLPPQELLKLEDKPTLINEPLDEQALNEFRYLEERYFGDNDNNLKKIFYSEEVKETFKENAKLLNQIKGKIAELKRQKSLIENLNERLDREQAEEGSASSKLSEILKTARQEQGIKQSINTDNTEKNEKAKNEKAKSQTRKQAVPVR